MADVGGIAAVVVDGIIFVVRVVVTVWLAVVVAGVDVGESVVMRAAVVATVVVGKSVVVNVSVVGDAVEDFGVAVGVGFVVVVGVGVVVVWPADDDVADLV